MQGQESPDILFGVAIDLCVRGVLCQQHRYGRKLLFGREDLCGLDCLR